MRFESAIQVGSMDMPSVFPPIEEELGMCCSAPIRNGAGRFQINSEFDLSLCEARNSAQHLGDHSK